MLKRDFTVKGLGLRESGENTKITPYQVDYSGKMVEEYDEILSEKYKTVYRILETIKKDIDEKRNKLLEKRKFSWLKQKYSGKDWNRYLDKRLIYLELLQKVDFLREKHNRQNDTFGEQVEKEIWGSKAQNTSEVRIQEAYEVAKKLQLEDIGVLDKIEKSIYGYKDFFSWNKPEYETITNLFNFLDLDTHMEYQK